MLQRSHSEGVVQISCRVDVKLDRELEDIYEQERRIREKSSCRVGRLTTV